MHGSGHDRGRAGSRRRGGVGGIGQVASTRRHRIDRTVLHRDPGERVAAKVHGRARPSAQRGNSALTLLNPILRSDWDGVGKRGRFRGATVPHLGYTIC